jgi:flagellar biosynthesis GTPase FlhF
MNRALPMFTHPLLMIRPILMVCALLLAMASMAQGRFTVNGRMKVDGSDMSGTRVVVYKNGVKERTLTSGLAKFSLDLDLQASYILSFEKDGFVAKKLSFNTKVPGDAAGDAFTPFDFAVSIFKQYDDVNIVVFNQPVGVIRYEAGMGDFDYDTDYTKSIQSQLQQTLAAVERKQKEEASKDEEEARNKERSEAEAKKQAELQAKADQAKAQAALKAEKEQAAAQARQEAEARKAAQLVQTQKGAPAATVPVAVVATRTEARASLTCRTP